MHQITGVDLTAIDGVDVTTALTVLAEIGPDLSRLSISKQFCAWRGVSPDTQISGGTILSSKTKRGANRARRALRLASASLGTSRSALGAYYRRLCARTDKRGAITAAAHKLARIIYAMLTQGQAYADAGQEYYEQRHDKRVLANLRRKAQHLGFELLSIGEPTDPPARA